MRASLEMEDVNFLTPLLLAIHMGNVEMVETLIGAGGRIANA